MAARLAPKTVRQPGQGAQEGQRSPTVQFDEKIDEEFNQDANVIILRPAAHRGTVQSSASVSFAQHLEDDSSDRSDADSTCSDSEDVDASATQYALRRSMTMISRVATVTMSKSVRLLQHYYFWYVAYLVVLIVTGALLMVLCGDDAEFIDIAFLSVSVCTMTGLSTNDFLARPLSTKVIVWLQIVVGNPMLLSLVPVLLRYRHSVKKQAKMDAKAGGAAFFGIETTGKDDRIALGMIATIVLGYWVFSILTGWLLLSLTLPVVASDGTPGRALFLSASAFHNAGLVTLRDGLPLSQHGSSIVLAIIMLLVLAGNTCFPMLLRGLVYTTYVFSRGRYKQVLRLLLKHPRTCYTHLFPAYATRWLCIVTPLLVIVQISALTLSYFMPANDDGGDPDLGRTHPVETMLQEVPSREAFLAMCFQSISTRTAGLSVVNLADISPTSAFVFSVCMWISVSPVVVVMRSTTRSGEVSLEYSTEVSRVERKEARRQQRKQDANIVQSQLTTFMSDNSASLLFLLFIILLSEEWSTGSEDVRDRRFLSIIFEFCSAYGTVGLSMSSGSCSRSGEWTAVSKTCLMIVMFLGRLRGLPDKIDPTFNLNPMASVMRPGFGRPLDGLGEDGEERAYEPQPVTHAETW